MSEPVSQMMTLLCGVVRPLPVGTNLALLHLLWMLVSGQLLLSRGAIIPALHQLGLSRRAVRRAWQALRWGDWSIGLMLLHWEQTMLRDGQWQARTYGGYSAVPIDLVGFYRPRLKACPTKHYDHRAGKALPAIVLGLVGRVGQVGSQRLLLPLGLLRVEPAEAEGDGLLRRLIQRAKDLLQPHDVLVGDGEFPLDVVLAEDVPRYVIKVAQNFTARRAFPPAYAGRGRPAQRGEIVRPLARAYRGRSIAATPPDRTEEWDEEGVLLRAAWWDQLVLRETKAPDRAGASTFSVLALYDPRFDHPLLVATTLTLAACHVAQLYRDRWAIEQLPLAAKQMIGAHRAFVWVAEVCQRWPELALLAGAILSYAAARLPAIPTGFWDQDPQPTPGRLRRCLGRVGFPIDFPLPPEIRPKASCTDHLPKGFQTQRRPGQPAPAP